MLGFYNTIFDGLGSKDGTFRTVFSVGRVRDFMIFIGEDSKGKTLFWFRNSSTTKEKGVILFFESKRTSCPKRPSKNPLFVLGHFLEGIYIIRLKERRCRPTGPPCMISHGTH